MFLPLQGIAVNPTTQIKNKNLVWKLHRCFLWPNSIFFSTYSILPHIVWVINCIHWKGRIPLKETRIFTSNHALNQLRDKFKSSSENSNQIGQRIRMLRLLIFLFTRNGARHIGVKLWTNCSFLLYMNRAHFFLPFSYELR